MSLANLFKPRKAPVKHEFPKPPPRTDTETITGTIRDIKGTQFRHWNEPTQSWWRCRNTHDLKIVTDALAADSPVKMTVQGKQLKELERA